MYLELSRIEGAKLEARGKPSTLFPREWHVELVDNTGLCESLWDFNADLHEPCKLPSF